MWHFYIGLTLQVQTQPLNSTETNEKTRKKVIFTSLTWNYAHITQIKSIIFMSNTIHGRLRSWKKASASHSESDLQSEAGLLWTGGDLAMFNVCCWITCTLHVGSLAVRAASLCSVKGEVRATSASRAKRLRVNVLSRNSGLRLNNCTDKKTFSSQYFESRRCKVWG